MKELNMSQAKKGNTVKVNYTGKFEDGIVFDTTSLTGEAMEFTIGANHVVPGFEKAVKGMKPGEKKTVHLKAKEAYGEYLAEKVFSNNENVKIINSIVHPVVIKTINEMFENEFKDEYIIFVEAALIYESKIEKYFDYVVVVYSDLENRINRIKQRDNSNEDEITRRMENQLSDEEKKEVVGLIKEFKSRYRTRRKNKC